MCGWSCMCGQEAGRVMGHSHLRTCMVHDFFLFLWANYAQMWYCVTARAVIQWQSIWFIMPNHAVSNHTKVAHPSYRTAGVRPHWNMTSRHWSHIIHLTECTHKYIRSAINTKFGCQGNKNILWYIKTESWIPLVKHKNSSLSMTVVQWASWSGICECQNVVNQTKLPVAWRRTHIHAHTSPAHPMDGCQMIRDSQKKSSKERTSRLA